MAKHKDTRSIDRRIAADVRARIMSGDLASGEKLPITTELMEHYGVSNQTIQRALNLLKAEGYLEGKSGRGVYVRDEPQRAFDTAATQHPAAMGEQYAWLTEAARQGKTGLNQILAVEEVVPPAQVRRAFGLTGDGTAILRKRLMLLDGEPAELCWSYYPLEIAAGSPLTERKKIRGGSPRLLADMGFPPREAIDQVSWRQPTEEEFLTLELPTEVPVGRTFRVVYSDEQRPVEASILIKAGHKYALLYRISVPTG
ncbi:GntR family transcriptional regulator [Streptomyces abikoensis]|uniref:GntR family transcriptional regulator n=1 Tax=Streptomyces abikoensis TaxID=97398 RepID=A0ABW7TEF9_9ACTN